jgi:hypothetical protein
MVERSISSRSANPSCVKPTAFRCWAVDVGVADERYPSERFPSLRQLSGAEDDLDGITGDLVELEPAWTVLSGH